ncbi:MAG: hypothetical protein KatS3mg118_3719 [Paracoccaceae bacterium]|nr:MAG: hypothetical protein KatS3mg118_3719 [Paracoccaceae bacterium]
MTQQLAHVQIMTPEEQQAMIARLRELAMQQAAQARLRAGEAAPAGGDPAALEPATAEPEAGAPASPAATPGTAARAQPQRPAGPARDPADPSTWGKVGRNEPCPCGSGRKYKACHGRI